MARFETYTSQGGITTQAPGNILPLDTYSQGAKNAQEMGKTMEQLSGQWQVAKDTTDNLAAKNKLMQETQAILNEAQNFTNYENTVDIDKKTADLTNRLNNVLPNVMQGFSNKENAQKFQLGAEFLLSQNGEKINHIMRGKTEDLFKGNFIQLQEANLNSFLVSGGDASYKADMLSAIDDGVNGGFINREIATKFKQEITNDWEVKLVEHLASTDPDGTLAMLKSGKFSVLDSQKAPLEKRIKEIKANNHALNERLKDQEQDTILEGFYNNIENKISQGLPLNYDDIPYGLNGKNSLNLKKYIDDFNKSGDSTTNIETWLYLYNLRTTNPQEFTNTNLTEWRAQLSDADYKSLLKEQVDMKNFTPIELAEDEKLFKEAARQANVKVGAFGIFDDRTKALQALLPQHLQAIEAVNGRPLTVEQRKMETRKFAETMQFTDGAARNKAIQAVTDGMNAEADYLRTLVNDVKAFEREKGSRATTEEKYKIIQQRAGKNAMEQNNQIRDAIDMSFYRNKITSGFGPRTAPITGASTDHKGVDIQGGMNEPFKSPVSGIVSNVGFDANLGKFVDIKISNTEFVRMGHANHINVKKGQQVNAGDVILKVGSTGRSTGPHTHLGWSKNGQWVNPMLQQGGQQIAQQHNVQMTPAPQQQTGQSTIRVSEGQTITNTAGRTLMMRGGVWRPM